MTLILWRPGRKRKGGCRLRQDGEADAAVARRFDSNRPKTDPRQAHNLRAAG